MSEIGNMDERLRQLYQNNPIVATALRLWLNGTIGYEEALIQCVLHLVRVNDAQSKEMMRLYEMAPSPANIHLIKERLEKLKEHIDE